MYFDIAVTLGYSKTPSPGAGGGDGWLRAPAGRRTQGLILPAAMAW